MWEWFTVNALWILAISAIVLLLILFARQRVEKSIQKAIPKKWHKTLRKNINFVLSTIGGICVVVIALALAAIILSREGVLAMITPETVQKWFQAAYIPIFL